MLWISRARQNKHVWLITQRGEKWRWIRSWTRTSNSASRQTASEYTEQIDTGEWVAGLNSLVCLTSPKSASELSWLVQSWSSSSTGPHVIHLRRAMFSSSNTSCCSTELTSHLVYSMAVQLVCSIGLGAPFTAVLSCGRTPPGTPWPSC